MFLLRRWHAARQSWRRTSGGAPELVRSDKYGLLANVNIEDIAEKISVALDKNWNRDEIVEYARGFTWEIAAKELNDLYGKVFKKFITEGLMPRWIKSMVGGISDASSPGSVFNNLFGICAFPS